MPRFEMHFVLNVAMCSADFTCVNGSTTQIVFPNCFKGLAFWTLNKNFQETDYISILLSFYVCSFIKLAQNTIVTTTSKLNLSSNASQIDYTHHFLRRCQVQVFDTFRYVVNQFYSEIFFTVYSRLLK